MSATPRPPRVSVQICTRNRREMLSRCLASLFNADSSPADFEVVLVDDGSTDGTAEMVAALSPPCTLRYIRQPHAGLASARNAGIRAAAGGLVLFLDDDVIAAPGLIAEHWRAHERHRGRLVVMGRVRHIDTPEVPATAPPRLADFSTSFFWTCNASVRRADLVEAGLFDDAFTEYGWEDLELGDRLRELGLRRRRSAGALVYHVKPPWRGSDLPRLVAQAEASGRSAVVYVRKAPTWRARLATGLSPARVQANLLAARCEPLWWRLARSAGAGELKGLARPAAWLLLRARYYRSVASEASPQIAEKRPVGSASLGQFGLAPLPTPPRTTRVVGAPARGARRVLVVRADAVGDTILTTPLLAALRAHSADMEICVVAATSATAVLHSIPHVDRVFAIDAARAPLSRRLALARLLRRERFDVAICVSEKWWPHVWTRASRAAVRIGMDPGATQPLKRLFLPAFLTHRVPTDADPFRASPLHEIERYLALLAPLGVDPAPARLVLPLSEPAAAAARQRVRDGLAPSIVPVAVHLSHKWSTEGWAASAIADLCADILARRADVGLVILGGAEEASLGAAVMDRLRGPAGTRVLNTGTTDFAEWGALIHACRALVTMDTAAAHLAAALGVPVVDVFQDHRFEHFATRWAPWRVPARALRRIAIPRGATAEDRATRESHFYRDVTHALGELL